VRSLLPRLGNLRRVGFERHRPVTCFVVPNVGRPDATGDQVVLALKTNPLPSVEQVT
jgi:hypothetical protein